MKLLYSNPNFSQVALVRSMLENEGIPTAIRNQHLSALMGELPALDTWPEIWVADEEFEVAQALVTRSQSQNTPEAPLSNWICPHCGAENDANVGMCWNCDYEIDGPQN